MLRHALRNGLRHKSSLQWKPAVISQRILPTRYYATVGDLNRPFKPGDQIHGFTFNRVRYVPELHLTAFQLEHDKTGAECLHIARDDQNNVFAISFKTNPEDDTGLPHILEHVTLCGSEKYPVRDPFFKMMPRSLANFMNAFTSSDYTSYPFATTNKQDYKNLASVYLDATLHPLLKRSDFLQEGWRLGPEDPKSPATRENIQFKGVVYNEMKGQMSDASYLYYIRFRDCMFPALFNSGGDPNKMTDLTHEQLVAFSRKHYHPSNSKIFSYGDLDLADHLKFLDGHLSRFQRTKRDKDIKMPRTLENGPLSFSVQGPVDTMQPPERQTKSSISWLGPETSDIIENFSVSIALSLLMNGYGSPLYQNLIEAGLGTNFSPNSGYDASGKQGILSIGLDGMKSKDISTLKSTIQSVLLDRSAEAFQPHKVEGYMHQLELALKHKTANFGMGVLEKTLPGWFNGVDPMEGLAWNETIAAFRHRLQEENYLQNLVAKYFMNDRCLQFTMEPWNEYGAVLEALEQGRRENILTQLENEASSPEAAISALGQQEAELLHEQEQAQTRNLETLPTLRVSDIPRQMERKPVSWSTEGPVHCLWRETSTNNITYFQAKHLLVGLPNELRLLLPLFTECLMRLGTKQKSVGEIEAEILLKTGGISISPFASPNPFDFESFSEGLLISGYALDQNVPAMLGLIRELVLDIDFSNPKATTAILELLESKVSGALDAVAEGGHQFAIGTAAAALSKRSFMQDQLSGLSQIEYVAKLLQAARDDSSSLLGIVEGLKMLQSIALSSSQQLSLRLVCEPSQRSLNERYIRDFMSNLPGAASSLSSNLFKDSSSGFLLPRRTFYNLPFQVSYTGTCLQTAPYGTPDKAGLAILGQLLSHNYLHPEVREKGGAYGASASASPLTRLFMMSSYRDPNPQKSLETFRKAGRFALDRDWSSRELEESKLALFQQVDAPTSPRSDGVGEFMYGITEEMKQTNRERLLDVNKEDVQRVAQRYLLEPEPESQAVCVLGEQKAWVEGDPSEWLIRRLQTSADT